MSKWWWLGLLIAWLVFVIIGAALIGVWASQGSVNCDDTEDSFGYFYNICNNGGFTAEYYGGLACLAIGGVLHLAYWIALIVWCTKRRHAQAVPIAYAMETPENKSYGYSVPYQPVPEPSTSYATSERYCGNCGSVVTAQFCQNCGGRP